jgi:hypothetical protein
MAFSTALPSIKKLRKLRVHFPLTDTVADTLSSRANLISLSFHHNNIIFKSALVTAFENPRKLEITTSAWDPSSLIAFLDDIEPAALMQLHLTFNHPGDHYKIYNCLEQPFLLDIETVSKSVGWLHTLNSLTIDRRLRKHISIEGEHDNQGRTLSSVLSEVAPLPGPACLPFQLVVLIF